MNPGVKADQGVDKSAHDFLQSWVVGKEPNKSVAYFSRLSYPCLEVMAQKSGKPVPPGMIRLRTMMAMQKFSDSIGTVNSVADVFEPADKWSQALKPAKNAYASEFLLVSVPEDMGARRGMRCHTEQRYDKGSRRNTSPLRFAENRETAGTRLCPCFGLRRAATGKSLPSASKMAVMRVSSQRTLQLRPYRQWKNRGASPVIPPP